MIEYTSKTGVWNIDAEDNDAPTLTVTDLQAGTMLRVTCQFLSRTMTDDLADGFEYRIGEVTPGNLITLTPDGGLVQGSDSWQLFSHVVLFDVPTAVAEATLVLRISKGGMNGLGSMMNLTLIAETVN